MSIDQAVILCGGRGTRLRPHTDALPKPMISCNGKPFVEYLIKQLTNLGVNRFVLLTGYLHESIESYFGDGQRLGVKISYSYGPEEWGTAKRLFQARQYFDDRFLILYSDNIVPFPLSDVMCEHIKNDLALTVMLSSKMPGNIRVGSAGRIESYDQSRSDSTHNHVEIGYMVAERDRLLERFYEPIDSFSDVLSVLATENELGGWLQEDSYHSISDPTRWRLAESYLKPKKIILLDRDGVLNRKAPRGTYVSSWSEFSWLQPTRMALRQLADQGFKFIVITNQAGLARGMLELGAVDEIHENMVSILREEDGVDIIDIYMCPHHWDEGCKCRKPRPGMLYQAASDHLLRLDQTIYVGDDLRDRQAANAACCPCLLIGPNSEIDCDVIPKELEVVRDTFGSAFNARAN